MPHVPSPITSETGDSVDPFSHPSLITPSLEHAIAEAKHLVVLTGAGVSAESGVPTFRSSGGLWAQYDPTQLATREAFSRDPDLVWHWYSWRRGIIRGVQPNPGHFALVEAETLFPRFSLITQNVDNLHRRAGSSDVHELHGNIERSRCLDCARAYPGDEAPPSENALRCECGGLIRPGVVWFGESLPESELIFAQEAARTCDLFLSVGTSGLVYPAAALPLIAHQNGAYVVEINPELSAIARQMDECIAAPSGVALPMIIETTKRLRTTA
ncbi:MAG: NAD-dependent deacylase [Bacteroidetes bacterium]|nr:NAD-dependent deacylase [Bacteroidota bacterium]